MTENRTTEMLRKLLDERGVKYDVKALRETEWTVNGVIWHANEYDGNLNVYVRNNDMLLTPEQAIAATLGNERATQGTLTAELVEKIVDRNCEWYEGGEIDAQAIADELNAELGSGTCKITATATNNLMYPDYMTKWYELSCGHSLTLKGDEAPKWCAVCGKAVER